MRKIWILSFLLISIALLNACSTNSATTEDGKLKILTTIYPLEDFTKKIGADLVEVKSIYPAGVDVHTFEPTSKSMIEIAESDLFIYSGTGIEAFAEDVVNSMENEEVKMVPAGEGLAVEAEHNEEEAHSEEEHAHEEDQGHEDEHSHEDEHGHNHGNLDPHVWIDPILSIKMAEQIKNELVAALPEEKATFEENFNQLKAELESLDEEFNHVISNAKTKKMIVSHGAYGYWERRYGLEQINISGLSTTQEPSQKQLEEIIEIAEQENIHYIIFEPNTSTSLAEVVQKAVGAEILYLTDASTLTDEDKESNEDYFSIMKRNIETLKTALN
ncbi:metal ABC transporter solute-binding protein, Zn/Mn family [Bacillus litorisediminis]|uniref:metal ABC transporter solute-binding protein, Zn/Mn family n=1 Tax=Bacillus litorisediminis TaxID=2922713 RepID=UPI001FAE4D1D|nr:zinc ABC transporter substrate-binding protein [Bacillus litorisediminis]